VQLNLLFNSLLKRLAPFYDLPEAESITKIVIEKISGEGSPSRYSMAPELTEENVREAEEIIIRLIQKEPIQYILGTAHFFGYDFKVGPEVLIPRRETEELVDWILNDFPWGQQRGVDLCTGSGCIAHTLKLERSNWNLLGVDLSWKALEIARENGELLGSKIFFEEKDVLRSADLVERICSIPIKFYNSITGDPLGHRKGFKSDELNRVDFIVSNPPYVRELEKEDMQVQVLDHEPEMALFVPDHDALIFYERIIEIAEESLRPGGKLYLEINEAFGKDVVDLMEAAGFEDVELRKDMQGKDRMVRGSFGGNL
jgi:release factor glutamine methyltransferase